MKKITAFKPMLILMALGMIFLAYGSCTLISPCDNRPCLNGGICIEGECTCKYGWAGDSCNILVDQCGLLADSCGLNAYDCKLGTCLCNSGWEGRYCDSLSKIKFLGNYLATETCNSGVNLSYSSSVLVSSLDTTLMVINNIHNLGITDELLVSPIRDSINIIPQTTISGLTVFMGDGYINSQLDTLRMSYGFFDNISGMTDTCQVVFIRQ